MQKGVSQNGYKLVGQLDLFQVLDEGLCTVNLFQGNRVLVIVRRRALFRGQRRARLASWACSVWTVGKRAFAPFDRRPSA